MDVTHEKCLARLVRHVNLQISWFVRKELYISYRSIDLNDTIIVANKCF